MIKLASVLCASGLALSAQWPSRPAPGIPRTPDGKPDLFAPAPHMADGRPDLSGLWMIKNVGSYFFIGGDLKPEEMQPWAAALYRQRQENYRSDTDGINCMPPGPKAGIGLGDFPLKILQLPGEVVVLYEYQTLFRQIFTDGRPLPKDPNPTWMGYSVAHWEGDTLVVTTAGYNDLTSLDLAGHPHTEALQLTERYHRRDLGHIDLKVSYDDPKAYTRTWSLSVELDLVPDGEIIEYICENERDKKHLIGVSGNEYHVPVETLARYVGTYESRGGHSVVSLEDDHLMIDRGAGKIRLVAHSETSFTMEGTGIDFMTDTSGATGMTEHLTEIDIRYVRKR